MDITYNLTMHFQNEIHRPSFPYKFKIKMLRLSQRLRGGQRPQRPGDHRPVARLHSRSTRRRCGSTWPAGFEHFRPVVRRCPTWALEWDAEAQELQLNPDDCVHCMHCINEMPKALRLGKRSAARRR